MATKKCVENYRDAVRNLPLADVEYLEKGGPCSSVIMKYAQSCYQELVSSQQTSGAKPTSNEKKEYA